MNTPNYTLVFILLYFGINLCLIDVKGQSAYEHFQLRPKSSRLGSGFQKLRSGLSIGQNQENGLKSIDPSAIVEQYEAANEDTKASRSSYRSLVVNGKGTVDGRKCSKNNMSAECTVKDYDIIEDYDYQDMNGSKQSVVIKKNDQESIDSDSTFNENRKSKQTQMRVRDQPNGTASKKISVQETPPGNSDKNNNNNHLALVEPEFHVVMPISVHKDPEEPGEKIVLNQETLDNPSNIHDEPEVIMEPTHSVAIKVDNSPEAVQKRIEQLEKEREDAKNQLQELHTEKKKAIESKKSQRFQSRSTIQEEIDQQSWIQTFDMKILGLEKHIKRLNEEIDSERDKKGGTPQVDKPLIKKKPQKLDGEKIDISKLQKLMGDQDNLELNLDNFNSEFESLEKDLEHGQDQSGNEMKAQNIDKGLDKIDQEFKKKRDELANETKNSKKHSPEYKEKLNKLAEKQKKTQENLQKLKAKKSRIEKKLKSKPKVKKDPPAPVAPVAAKPVENLQNLQNLQEKNVQDKVPKPAATTTSTTTTTKKPLVTKKILVIEPTDPLSKEISDLEKRLEQLDSEKDDLMNKVKSLKNSREEYERRVEANNMTNHMQNVPGSLQDTDPNLLKSFENEREIHNKRQLFNSELQDYLIKMKIISQERKEVEAKLAACKAKLANKPVVPEPPKPKVEDKSNSHQIHKISNNLLNLESDIRAKEKELHDLELQRNSILGQQKQFYLTIRYIVRFGSQEGEIIKSIDGYLEGLNADMAFEKDRFVYNSELSSMLERIHQIMNEIRRYQIYLIEARQKGLKREIESVDIKLTALFAQKRARCHSLREFSVKFVTRFGSQNEEIVEKIEKMMDLFTTEQDTHDQIQYLHQRLQALISKIAQLNRKKEELQTKLDTDATLNTEKMMSAVVRDIKSAEDQKRLLHSKLKEFNSTYTIKFGEDQSIVAQQIEDFLDKLNQYKIRFEWLEHIHLCLLKIYKLLAEKSELELLIRALREESVHAIEVHKILQQIHKKESELQRIEREKDNDVAEVREFKIKYITRFGSAQEDIIHKIETIMETLSDEDLKAAKSSGYNSQLHKLEIRILKLKNDIRDLRLKLKSLGHPYHQNPHDHLKGKLPVLVHPKQKANLNKLTQEIRNLKEKLDKMNKEKELLQAKLYKYRKLQEYEEKLEKLKEEGQFVMEELDKIKHEKERLERQKNELEREKKLALLVKRSEEENSKLLQIKQQIAQLEAEIKQLNEQIYVKGHQAEWRHEGWRQTEEEMIALNKERDHTAKLIKKLYDQKKSLETKPDHVKVEQINGKLDETDRKIKHLAEEQDKSEEELLRIKVEKETAEKKMADLEGLQEANHREQETIKNRRSLGDDKHEELQRLDRELVDSKHQWEIEYEAVKGLKAKYEELEELSKKLKEEKRLAEEETQILRAALETSLNEAQRNKEAENSANEDKEKILQENRRLQAKLGEEEEQKRMGLEKMKADSDRNLKKKLSKITKVKEQDEQKSYQLKEEVDEAREKAENLRKEKTEAEKRARNDAMKDAKVSTAKKEAAEDANRNFQNEELKKATESMKPDQEKMDTFDGIKEQDDQFARMRKEQDRFQDSPAKGKNDENKGEGRLAALNAQKDRIDRERNRLMEDTRQAENRKQNIKMDQAAEEPSKKGQDQDVLSFDTLTKKVTEDVPESPPSGSATEDHQEKSRQEMILKKEEELRKAMRDRRKEAMNSRALRKELGELQKKLDDLKKRMDQHEKMTKVKERDERLARKLKPFTAAEEAKCKKEKAAREAEAKKMAAQKSDLEKKARKVKVDCDAADKRLNALMDYEQKAQRDREIARQMEFQKEAEQMAQNRRNIEKQEREKKLQQQMRMEAKKIQDVGSQIERREDAREREENRKKNDNSRKSSSSDRRARLEKERQAALSKKRADERQRKNSYQGIMGMDTSDMLGTDLLGSALTDGENDGLEKGGFAIPLDMKLDAELQHTRVNFNDDESSLRPPGGPREPLTDQMRGRAIQVFRSDENGKTVDSEITDSSAASASGSKSSHEDTKNDDSKNEDLYGLIPKDEFDSSDNNHGKSGADEILKPSKSST